jgi:hypothetical protein
MSEKQSNEDVDPPAKPQEPAKPPEPEQPQEPVPQEGQTTRIQGMRGELRVEAEDAPQAPDKPQAPPPHGSRPVIKKTEKEETKD